MIRVYVNKMIGTGRNKKMIQSIGSENFNRVVWVLKDGNTVATKIDIARTYLDNDIIYSNSFYGFVKIQSRVEPTEEEVEAMIKVIQKNIKRK